MTYTTEADIRELKTAVEAIGRGTEALTKAIEALAKATEANAKAIADLTLEMRVGFTGIQGQIGNLDTKLSSQIENLDTKLSGEITHLDTKLSGKIDNVESKLSGAIDTLTGKFDERKKDLGQRLDGKGLAQRNIFTGLTVTIVGSILLTLSKYLFSGQ